MSSPLKRNNGYTGSGRSIKVDIIKELSSAERRAVDLNKQFSQSIAEASAKTYFPQDYDDSTPWDHHKLLMKRGDEYSQYLLEQNSRSKQEKQEAVNEVNQKVKRTLNELDIIREEENKGLTRKIIDCNKDFGKKVKELEKSVARQIEIMKVELMESIRNEEKECEKRITERSKKLIDESIPQAKRENPDRIVRTGSASPTKFYMSTPEKRNKSNLAMQKLEESREKVRQLRTHAYTVTPQKEPYEHIRRRQNSGIPSGFEDVSNSSASDMNEFRTTWQ